MSLSEKLGIRVFLRILHLLHEYQFKLILACLCSLAVASLTAVLAWSLRPFLDGIFLERNQLLLMLFPIALLLVTVAKSLFTLLQDYLIACVSNWFVADIRHQLYIKMIRLPIKFHDANSSGRLVARVMSDATIMGNAIPQLTKNLIQQALTFFALVGVSLYQEWKLTLVLLVLTPIVFYGIYHLGFRIRQLATRSQELIEDMTFHLKETFSGIRVLKAFNKEEFDRDRFLRINHSFTRVNIKSSQWSALSTPVIEIIGVLGISSIVMYCGNQVMNGKLTPGAFYSFVAALVLAYDPIRKLGRANKMIQASIAAGQRVFAILDLEYEENLGLGKKTLPPISDSLEFRNVTFYYEGSQKPALEGINLTLHAGEVVALVGRTGSGKTTLANLILRFYDPDEGTIFIDGENILDISLPSLRRQIAIVDQDAILFDDTVKNNIAYSRVDARDEDIVSAARAAYALEFIERLPSGFDTVIGEKGIKLSGGQRQRIAIARAILRNPPILILDEATSSLDSESEQIVQRALSNLMENRTTLMIAHRLSTIQRATRIVVLNQGRIAGVGSSEALLAGCEAYQKLHRAQFEEILAEH